MTDWWDGFLARRLKQITKLGAFLDPVADKLIVTAALIVIVSAKNYHYIAIPALVIIGREIVISALREVDGRNRPARPCCCGSNDYR